MRQVSVTLAAIASFASRLYRFSLVRVRNCVCVTKEYLRRVAARDETDAEKWNLGQTCHALVCRRIEPAESTMPLISLELSDTES